MKNKALTYQKMNISVIPVKKDKRPYISWQDFQKRIASTDEIEKWWKQWPDANVGIITGMVSGIAVIDIDTEEGKQAIQEYIPDSIIMPIANTPSGGQHYYFKCPDEKISNNARVVEGCDLRANGGYVVAPPSKNGTGKAYTWLEGLSIFEVEMPELPEEYLHIIKNSLSVYTRCNKKDALQDVTKLQSVTDLFKKGRRDNDLFHVANCLIKGGMQKEVATEVLKLLANSCNPPFAEREVLIKIQSAFDRTSQRVGRLSDEIEEWISVTNGYFSVTQCNSELHCVTKQEKTNVRQVFYRLKEKNIIEPVGGKAGQYRRIEKSFEPVQKFEDIKSEGIELAFPLEIDNYAKIFPSNIIIVAGGKSTGKTAFCLNFATLNIDHPMKKRYISSEFGSDELYERLVPMEVDPDEWIKKIQFNRFRGEPQDAIIPDGINIIDYLEIKEGEFFKIGSQIDKIYNKLEKGIALIALQMNPGQDIARGGAMTLDKSRLYLTLTRKRTDRGLKNYIEIKDCKHFAIKEQNPNGYQCEYKLGGGHFFKRMNAWLPG